MEELERRLRGRGTDTPAEIAQRMATAHNEISHWIEFDHVVLNDVFPDTLAAVRAILQAARLRTERQTGLADFVARLSP